MIARDRTANIALASLALLASAPASLAQHEPASPAPPALVLRAGEPAPLGDIIETNPEGVVVDGGTSAPVLVPWDRVLTLTGSPDADHWRADGVALWRAWARLARGDSIAAEPLFEDLARRRAGMRGPTTARALEGLLRCRLDRGARALALTTWLELQHAATPAPGPLVYQRRPDSGPDHAPTHAPAGTMPGIEHPGFALVPDLPPIWPSDAAVRALADAPPPDALTGRAAELASLYQAAARFATHTPGEQTPTPGQPALPPRPHADRGAELVWAVVAAQSPDRAEREQGLALLRRMIDADPEPWVAAWAHTALGRGLARSPEPDDRRRAVLHLLRLPASLDWAVPHLSVLALADAAAVLDSLGDAGGAAALRAELAARTPAHHANPHHLGDTTE